MEKTTLNLAAKLLSELALQAQSIPAAYTADKKTKPIPVENFKVVVIPTKFGDWRKVEFEVEGQDRPFSIGVKNNRVIDEDASVMIQRFVALDDYTTTGGVVIKAGTAKWFAVQTA